MSKIEAELTKDLKTQTNESLNIVVKEYFEKNPEHLAKLQGEFKHEVRQFQKPYDNQQAEQISLMV